MTNQGCSAGRAMKWNGIKNGRRKISVWNMKLLKYGMEWNGKNFPYFRTSSILAHFNVVFILSAVNKAAFDQM